MREFTNKPTFCHRPDKETKLEATSEQKKFASECVRSFLLLAPDAKGENFERSLIQLASDLGHILQTGAVNDTSVIEDFVYQDTNVASIWQRIDAKTRQLILRSLAATKYRPSEPSSTSLLRQLAFTLRRLIEDKQHQPPPKVSLQQQRPQPQTENRSIPRSPPKKENNEEVAHNNDGKKEEPPREGKSIELRVRCKNQQVFDLLKRGSAGFNANDVEEAMRNSLRHQIELALQGYIRKLYSNKVEVHEVPVKDQQPSFRKHFECEYIPSTIDVELFPIGSDKMLLDSCARQSNPAQEAENCVAGLQLKVTISEATEKEAPSEQNRRILERFKRYLIWLRWPEGRKFRFVEPNSVTEALQHAEENLIGVHLLTKLMEPDMKLFSSIDYDVPHGILFHGPPGTGKTTIVNLLCSQMDVVMVCDPLASSDFNRPYKGESERMVNEIARRAMVVPWQLCALSIDEIDALAPSRGGRDSEKHSVDLLSSILSIVGGNKDVKNLVLFGATNRLSSMDDAFLRRMPAKFFVGRPSFDARREWIQWKMLQHGLPIGSILMRKVWKDLESKGATKGFKSPSQALQHKDRIPQQCKQGMDAMVGLTINFSNDAMRLLLSMLHETRYAPGLSNDSDAIEEREVSWFVEHICHAERIYLGDRIVPDIKREAKLPPVDALIMKRVKAMDILCQMDAQRIDLEQQLKDRQRIKTQEPQKPQQQQQQEKGKEREDAIDRLPCCTHRMLVNFNSEPEDQFTIQLMHQRELDNSSANYRIFEGYLAQDWWTQIPMTQLQSDLFISLGLDKKLPLFGDMVQKLVRITRGRGYKADNLATIEDFVKALGEVDELHKWITSHKTFLHADLSKTLTLWPLLKSEKKIQDWFAELNAHVNDKVVSPQHKDILLNRLMKNRPGQAFLADCFQLLKDPSKDISTRTQRINEYLMTFCNTQQTFLAIGRDLVSNFLRRIYSKQYLLKTFGATGPEPLNYEQVLMVLIDRAISCKLEAVFFINNATLIHHKAIEDSQAQEYVKHVLEEARNYRKSMVIFDLDSIANVSKSFQSLTKESAEALLMAARRETFYTGGRKNDKADNNNNLNDETFSFTMQRPNLLAMVLQEIVQATSKDNMFWMVAMTEDLVLTSRFKQMFTTAQWPLSPEEKENEETQRELRQKKVCRRCSRTYTELDNEEDSCSRHQMDLCVTLKTPSSGAKTDHNKPSSIMTFEEFSRRILDSSFAQTIDSVRWLCCQRGPWDQGELPCKHESSVLD